MSRAIALSNNVPLNSFTALFFCLGRHVVEDMIHLLQSPALGLWNKEESPDQTQQAEDGEENISAVSCILDQRWGNQSDDEVAATPIRLNRHIYVDKNRLTSASSSMWREPHL